MAEDEMSTNSVELATELTIAWLSNPNTRASAEEIPGFLKTMHSAVAALGGSDSPEEPDQQAAEYVPAVTSRRSLSSRDHIISMIDGKPYKTLRRHLSRHGLSPQEYRDRYGLKSDYPMVAPAYADMRRDMAKKIGLGRRSGKRADAPAGNAEETPAAAPKRRGRPPKAG